MNQASNSPYKLRDIAHAATLLILVPVVFYGGYQLVSRTTDTERAPVVFPPVAETLKKAKGWTNGSSPRPVTAWLDEIDRLKNKLSLINAVESDAQTQKNRLANQLRLLREHCDKFASSLHDEISDETHLGRTLLRFANEIDGFQRQSPQAMVPLNWEAKFELTESKRLSQQAASTNTAFDQQVAPMRQVHAKQLASVTRQNRELADELQRTNDRIQKIERDAREDRARQQRLVAYTKDKNEIDRLLKPFTTPAYTQLGRDWTDWKKTAEKRPLSYRDLERLGALSSGISGILNLARIGSVPAQMHPNTARPLGSFPLYYDEARLQPSQLETIKRAQHLLKEHSVYLIEAGFLLP